MGKKEMILSEMCAWCKAACIPIWVNPNDDREDILEFLISNITGRYKYEYIPHIIYADVIEDVDKLLHVLKCNINRNLYGVWKEVIDEKVD